MNKRIKQKYGHHYKKQRSWDLFSYLAEDIAKDLNIYLRTCHDLSPEWKNKIRQMKWSFYQLANDYPDSPWNINWNIYWKKYGQYRSFDDWFEEREDGHTYHKSDDRFVPPDKELEKIYYDKVQAGVDLFVDNFIELVNCHRIFKRYPQKLELDMRAFIGQGLHGCPAPLAQGIDSNSDKADEISESGFKKWLRILNQIHETFANISKNQQYDENGLKLFAKYFEKFWD